MLRALAALLCAILSLSAAQAQYRPGYAPNFRSGFQFIGGLPTYDFANGSYPPVTVSRASSGDLAADAAGNYSSFAANALRRTNAGATIEGAQTNLIRNNTMQGAVAGTPGTVPANWIVNSVSGLTRTIALQTRNGVDGILLTFSGTTTASGQINIVSESYAQIVAVSGQLWSASWFLQIDASTGVGQTYIEALERDSGGNSLVGSSANLSGSGFQRTVINRTLNNASTAFINTRFNMPSIPNGTAVNFSIWIGLPDLERRDTYVIPTAGTSTPIRTTGTAATRAADAVSFTVPAGASKILYTFDDGSQQQVSVSPGAYTIPTNLNRPVIARAQVLP